MKSAEGRFSSVRNTWYYIDEDGKVKQHTKEDKHKMSPDNMNFNAKDTEYYFKVNGHTFPLNQDAYDMTPNVRKIQLLNDVATILAGITIGVSLLAIHKGGTK